MIIISNDQHYDKNTYYDNIVVQNVNYQNVKKNWNYIQRFSHSYKLFYIVSGTLHVKVNEEVFVLEKDTYIIIPPFCTITSTLVDHDSCTFYTFSFNGDFSLVKNNLNQRKTIFDNTFLLNIFKTMLTVYNPSVRNNNYLGSLFLAALYELDRLSASPLKTGFPLQKILDYIYNNLNQPLSLCDLSREFNYSTDYISRNFKAQFGIGAKEYINRLKLASAKRLLATSTLSLQKVGEHIGYEDVELFYKFFRYYEKESPAKYRKKYSQI